MTNQPISQITLPGGVTLRPGDALIYGPSDLLGWLICVKTWSWDACHIEVYAGEGQSVASRNGIGVRKYDFRREQLAYVARPNEPFMSADALRWFEGVNGQAYDWKGLLCFTLAVRQGSPNKMFCSEFATRFYRHAMIDAVNPKWDADKVAPGNFLMSPAFDWIWENKQPTPSPG